MAENAGGGKYAVRVLDYLKKHKNGITSKIAVDELGIMQLPHAVFKLRMMGHNIMSVPFKGKNRFGESVSFVRYVLEE